MSITGYFIDERYHSVIVIVTVVNETFVLLYQFEIHLFSPNKNE